MNATLFFPRFEVEAMMWVVLFFSVSLGIVCGAIVGVFFYAKFRLLGTAQKMYSFLLFQRKKRKFEQEKSRVLTAEGKHFVRALFLLLSRWYQCKGWDMCSKVLTLGEKYEKAMKEAYYQEREISEGVIRKVKEKVKNMKYSW